MQHSTDSAFFDWYAATVNSSALELEDILCAELGAEARDARGLHGYSWGRDFVRDGDVVAKMIFGGGQSPHVWSSGADARDLARVLRVHLPDHYVTRVDVAYDFDQGSPWSELYAACVTEADYLDSGVKRARPLKLVTAGDWVREAEGFPGGRTLYVGSMKSPVMARLYEKGKQMRALFPDQVEKFDEGWVRLELQVRPQDDARYEVAKLDPHEIWGVARWARSLHSRVFSSDLEGVRMAVHRPADDERAFRFMLRQYGPLLRRTIDLQGLEGSEARLEAYAELGRRLGRALG